MNYEIIEETDDYFIFRFTNGLTSISPKYAYLSLQPERLNPEACNHSGINIMNNLGDESQECSKCGSIFTGCDSLTTTNK